MKKFYLLICFFLLVMPLGVCSHDGWTGGAIRGHYDVDSSVDPEEDFFIEWDSVTELYTPRARLDGAEIAIDDLGAYYTVDTVEGALQEIGTGWVPYTGATSDVDLGAYNITAAIGTFGDITIFDATPILVFQDSNSAGAASVGFIEWKDSGGGRAGFLGNNSSGNDDLYWKNEQGGNIGIETTGAGNLNIIATLAQFNATPITTTGKTTTNDFQVDGSVYSSLVPDTSNAYDLGSATYNWYELYVGNIIAAGGVEAYDVGADNYYDQGFNAQWGDASGAPNFTFLGAITTTSDVRIVSDSNRIELGNRAGGDAAIWYGGSHLYINPRIYGSGNVLISAGELHADTIDAYGANAITVGNSSYGMTSPGDLNLAQYIKHIGDADTHIAFTPNVITFTYGGTAVTGANIKTAYDHSQISGGIHEDWTSSSANLDTSGDVKAGYLKSDYVYDNAGSYVMMQWDSSYYHAYFPNYLQTDYIYEGYGSYVMAQWDSSNYHTYFPNDVSFANVYDTSGNYLCYMDTSYVYSFSTFVDSYSNYSDTNGWQDASNPERKTLIRGLTVDEPEYFYDLLDTLKIKSYRYKADVEIVGYDDNIKVKDHPNGKLKPAPIYGDATKAPERFGLMADELPDFLSSKDKKGINANKLVAFLIPIVQHQKKLIADLESRITALENM